MNTDVLVSIICITYNHEQYIKECLNSFLAQKVNFNIEILVHDDASTDCTQQILQEYQRQYPSVFKLFLQSKNQFSQGNGYVGIFWGLKEARGKYIAYCEGDDYWCDEYKLQKQVDFLEKNHEYEICAHDTNIINEATQQQVLFSHTNVNIFLNRKNRQEYTFDDTLTGNIFHISSIVFRNIPLVWPKWINDIRAFDMVMYMLLAQYGKIFVMRDVMSVYRTTLSSITRTNIEFSTPVRFNNVSIDILSRMNEFWDGKYKHKINKILSRYYVHNMFLYLSKSYRNYTNANHMMLLAMKCNVPVAIKYILSHSYRKLKKHF